VAARNLKNQMILVRSAKIEAIGANLAIPSAATVIDLSHYRVVF
jgi:dihydroorotase-like cyclic amidohydrolase